MKHCPECNKNYADPTLSFCLQDGAPLIFGSAVEEPATAILSDDPTSETPTRHIDPHTTQPTESIHFPELRRKTARPHSRSVWLIVGIAVIAIVALVAGYLFYG